MMSELLTAYKAKFHAVCCVVLLLLSILSGSSNIVLVGVFAFVLILSTWINNGIRLNEIDITVLLIFVYEIILGNTLYGRNNSLKPILTQFIFTAFYFIIRLSAHERGTIKMVLKWSSIFFIVASLFCVVSFLTFRGKVLSAGFDVLSDFKFLYRPFGSLNNVWATFLLCFWLIYLLYVLFYSTRNSLIGWWFASLPLLYCLIISFSRGIYICVGTVFVGLLISLLFSRNFSARFKIITITVFILSLSALALIHEKEFIQTAKLIETVSQQRSLDSRVSSLSYLPSAMNDIPVWGVGTGNYAMAMDKYLYQDDNNSYTNTAPNIIYQIAIEKGIIGIVLWATLIVAAASAFKRSVQRARKEQLSILFMLAVMFLRELSFSSLLLISGLRLLLALLLGIYANNLVSDINLRKHRKTISIMIASAILCVFVYCAMVSGRYSAHRTNIQGFKESLEKDQYDDAEAYLNKCRSTIPTFFYRAVLHKKRYLQTKNNYEIDEACDYMAAATEANPLDIRLKYEYAMTLYLAGQISEAQAILKQLCLDFPNNALFHATWGNILYAIGDKRDAIPHFVQTIELAPFVLETEAWKKFEAVDSLSCTLIISTVESDLQKIEENPIKLAKFGKIMYLVGCYDVAEKLLHKALDALPNLQSPWVCLWKIALYKKHPDADEYLKRAQLLGDDNVQNIRQETASRFFNDGPLPIDAELYDSNYSMKFEVGYATKWYPKVLVF